MTSAEVGRIVERMATAPFDPRDVPVPRDLRGRTYQGHSLGGADRSLFVHLAQRVLIDREWAAGTTEEQYLADLRRAVRDPATRLVIYIRRGGHIARLVAENEPILRRILET